MKFVEWLKKYDNFDRYILFLLSLDLTVIQVANLCEVTTQHVYNVIGRNKDLIKEYAIAVAKAMPKEEETTNERNGE